MTGDDASGLEKLIGYIRQDVQNLDRKIDDRFDKMVSAEAFRAEGERQIALATRRSFPFDGTLCDFRPDPGWAPPQLPEQYRHR